MSSRGGHKGEGATTAKSPAKPRRPSLSSEREAMGGGAGGAGAGVDEDYAFDDEDL